MGRTVRQKRKSRSSRPVVRQHNSRKRPVNPTGNVVIAQNWDKTLTLTQNYRRLGLMNRLRQPTGGVERLGTDAVSERAAANSKEKELARHADPFRIENVGSGRRVGAGASAAATGAVREVRVERDASGRIVRVVGEAASAHNPLDDPLNELDDDEDGDEDGDDATTTYEEWGGFEDETKPGRKHKKTGAAVAAPTPVVAALEKMANRPVGPKHVQYQSSGERSWLQALVNHYGQVDPDEAMLTAMAHDRRRNPFQRTAADLRRRLAKFRAAGGAVTRP